MYHAQIRGQQSSVTAHGVHLTPGQVITVDDELAAQLAATGVILILPVVDDEPADDATDEPAPKRSRRTA